jgi:hypothetical protein
MKKSKMILMALGLTVVVSGAFAFKTAVAKKHVADRFIISGGQCILGCASQGTTACFTTAYSDNKCKNVVSAFNVDQ